MSSGGGKQTVGYWYRLLYHAGLGKGPIDAFLEFRGGEKTAWKGALTSSGTISVDAPNLWGGESGQGGIVGDVDVMFGESDQQPNAYLLANLGDQVPAWRGLATLVFKGGRYGAINPYPQKASYKILRTKAGWDSGCWYPEKSEIVVDPGVLFTGDLAFDAQLATLDGSIAGIELTEGFGADDVLLIDKPPGLTYQAWSYWATDGEVTDGLPWTNALWVTDGSGATTQYWGGERIVDLDGPVSSPVDGRYATAAEAEAAVQDEIIILSGSEYYRIWLFDVPPTDNRGGLSVRVRKNGLVAMNPAHALYYSRTSAEMGREPESNIDSASLTSAADRLHAEGFGICTERDPAQESPDEFEARIARVIDGSFSRDPITGLWHLDLARGDYVLGDLPVLVDDDIIEFREIPFVLENAVNSVSVTYFDQDKKEAITTPPVQALALVAAFGTIHQTIEYREIPSADLAGRVAQRELLARATPARTFELVCTRRPYSWRPGTYFRLQCQKRGITDMVCILGDKKSGTLRSGAIRLTATQDIYTLPEYATAVVEPGVDTSVDQAPTPITAQAAMEAPYVDVVAALSRADLAVLPVDVGYLLAVADDPALSINYTAMADDGSGYTEAATGDWVPTATIVEAAGFGDTAFSITGGSRLDEVAIGSAGLWGAEIVRVDSLDAGAGTITLGRGCADTAPAKHSAGERIWFYVENAAVGETEYTDGETIAVKLLTNTASQQLDIADAAALSVAFDGRAARPYPPGNVQINATTYPECISGAYSLSWAHRDRISQADQLIDTTLGNIGPEAGTTYTLRLYGEIDTLLRTETGLTGTSYTWSAEEADSGLTVLPAGGGGGPAAINPADAAGLLRWYRAEALALDDDDPISSWTDLSAADNHATQGTASNQPTYKSSILNGRAVARFDGGDWLAFDKLFDSSSSSGAMLVVARNTGGAAGAMLSTRPSGSNQGWTFRLNSETESVYFHTGYPPNVSDSFADAFHIHVLLRDGLSITIGVEDDLNSPVSVGGFSGSSLGSTIIGAENGGSGSRLTGDIAEIVILDNTDSATVDGLVQYLLEEYFGAAGAAGAAPRRNGTIRAELESVRDGLTSHQMHNITVDRAGYGYQYGNYYGGSS